MAALRIIRLTLLLATVIAAKARASPISNHEVAQRTVRCDFPGVLINKSTRDMLINFDNGSSHVNATVQPDHSSTEFICDADFIYPLGYNFITTNTKGPKAGSYNVSSGGSFKMDAYTFECHDGQDRDVWCLSTYNGNQ